jgi:AcrR family transcriptional regulator
MAETESPADRVVDAAMALAARRPWREVGLADIAAEAGLDLAGLRAVAASKAHILALFARRIDRLLLGSLSGERLEGEPHDRLFDVLMRRLEIMEPWRAALKSILAAGPGDPIAAAAGALGSVDAQRWIAAAAGLPEPRDGLSEGARLLGLAFVQHRILGVWVEDEDPGHARTMAALDRLLRDGAQWMKRLDVPLALCAGFCRLLASLAGTGARPSSPSAPPESKPQEKP